MRHRTRTTARGRAGITHCGTWTPRIPDGWYATRIVCNRPARHRGPHRDQAGHQWVGDETPRRTEP